MALYQPDRYFSRVSAIDPRADLLACGFSHVLLDIDNTILSRADHQVPRDVKLWLQKVRSAGIAPCFLSNNFHVNVHELAAQMDIPIVAKALKPLPHGFFMARRKVGGTRTNTVMIGDQLSTDVVGAHLAGMKAYLVCPLVEEDLKHTKFVRVFENALISDREPEGASACEPARLQSNTQGSPELLT